MIKELYSLIAQREENKRLYIKPLSKKITALKKLIEQNKRRKNLKNKLKVG